MNPAVPFQEASWNVDIVHENEKVLSEKVSGTVDPNPPLYRVTKQAERHTNRRNKLIWKACEIVKRD